MKIASLTSVTDNKNFGFSQLRVAIVHYWLIGMRGGERVLEELLEIFPQADIFTHVYDSESVSPRIRSQKVKQSFIGHLPRARRHYQSYLPLMPMALEELDLRGYDLIISSESGPAKGIIPPSEAFHLCYCHSPMRYVWNMYNEYKESSNFITRSLMRPLSHYMRLCDVAGAARVDHFVANSNAVARRIEKYYRRDADVVPPPVDIDSFAIGRSEDFYLYCGQLVPYKRVDVAIEACNRLGRRLIVIGSGSDIKRLTQIAGPTVTILGAQPFEVLREHYARCRALLFPGEEDFGIVPVEAMASGRPVIGYGRGGLCDTVIDGKTGILFEKQTTESLIDAIKHFERIETGFDPKTIRDHAATFNKIRFRLSISQIIACRMQLPEIKAPANRAFL